MDLTESLSRKSETALSELLQLPASSKDGSRERLPFWGHLLLGHRL